MPISPEDYLFYIKKELTSTYFKIKEVIIEAEELDPERQAYIASFNEIRNTLDHIIKASLCENTDDLASNLNQAKVHLNRAGYDTYEILASNLGLAISKAIEKYPSEIISRVFPSYYTNFQPQIINIQKKLSEIRSLKNVDENWNPGSFEIYDKNKNELVEIYKSIQGYIPLLEKERKRNLWNFILNNIITIAITLLVGIIVGMGLFKLGLV